MTAHPDDAAWPFSDAECFFVACLTVLGLTAFLGGGCCSVCAVALAGPCGIPCAWCARSGWHRVVGVVALACFGVVGALWALR